MGRLGSSTLALIAITLLGFIKESRAIESCSSFETEMDKAPKLQVKLTQFKNIKDHQVIVREIEAEILINRTKAYELKLDCWAPYPIDLTFSGHLTNEEASVKTIVTPYRKSDGAKGQCYRINVTMDTYEQITGNYSCFAVMSPNRLRTSKYIYVFCSELNFLAAPPGVLLKRGQNLTIEVDPKKNALHVFPCAVSNPDVEVQLHKMNGKDPNWLLPSKALKFDPKLGFTMTLATNEKSQLGSYQCITTIDPLDVINIQLVEPPALKVEPDLSFLRLKIGDRLNLTCMAKEEVYISFKSTSSGVTTILNNTKSTPNKNYQYVTVSNMAIENNSAIHSGGMAECLTTRDNSSIHVWNLAVANEPRKIGILETSRLVDSCSKADSEKSIVLFECNNWIECRINRCVAKDQTCKPSNQCQLWSCNPHGIVQCVSPRGSIYEVYFTGFNGTRYTNWRLAPRDEVLRVTLPRNLNGLGAKGMTFHCEGSSFAFSAGFQWSLFLTNGDSVDLIDSANDSVIKETWGRTRSTLLSTLILPLDFYKTTQVAGVVCLAPVWNGTDGVNQTMNLNDMLSYKLNYDLQDTKIQEEKGSTGKGSNSRPIGTRSSQTLCNPSFILILSFPLITLFRG